MKSPQDILIKNQQINLDLVSGEDRFFITERLEEIYHSKINRLIGEVFAEFRIPDDTVIEIDQIDIDLGTITARSYSDFESTFLAQLRGELRHYIRRELGKEATTSSKTAREVDELQDMFQKLRSFIQKGRLPWWGIPMNDDPEHLIRRLLDSPDYKVRIERLIGESVRSTVLLRRVSSQFSMAVIRELIQMKLGDQHATLALIIFRKIEKELKLIPQKIDPEMLSGMLREIVLHYLYIGTSGSQWNAQSFEKHIRKEAQAAIKDKILRVPAPETTVDEGSVKHTATELGAEPEGFHMRSLKELDLPQQFELFSQFLVQGSLPDSFVEYSSVQLEALFMELSIEHPEKVIDMIEEIGQYGFVRERITHQFSESLSFAILKLIVPEVREWISALTITIRQLPKLKTALPLIEKKIVREAFELIYRPDGQTATMMFASLVAQLLVSESGIAKEAIIAELLQYYPTFTKKDLSLPLLLSEIIQQVSVGKKKQDPDSRKELKPIDTTIDSLPDIKEKDEIKPDVDISDPLAELQPAEKQHGITRPPETEKHVVDGDDLALRKLIESELLKIKKESTDVERIDQEKIREEGEKQEIEKEKEQEQEEKEKVQETEQETEEKIPDKLSSWPSDDEKSADLLTEEEKAAALQLESIAREADYLPAEVIEESEKVEIQISAIITYLLFGVLPAAGGADEPIDAESILRTLIEKHAGPLQDSFLQGLPADRISLRLSESFTPETLDALLGVISPDISGIIRSQVILSEAFLSQIQPGKAIEKHIRSAWRMAWYYVMKKKEDLQGIVPTEFEEIGEKEIVEEAAFSLVDFTNYMLRSLSKIASLKIVETRNVLIQWIQEKETEDRARFEMFLEMLTQSKGVGDPRSRFEDIPDIIAEEQDEADIEDTATTLKEKKNIEEAGTESDIIKAEDAVDKTTFPAGEIETKQGSGEIDETALEIESKDKIPEEFTADKTTEAEQETPEEWEAEPESDIDPETETDAEQSLSQTEDTEQQLISSEPETLNQTETLVYLLSYGSFPVGTIFETDPVSFLRTFLKEAEEEARIAVSDVIRNPMLRARFAILFRKMFPEIGRLISQGPSRKILGIIADLKLILNEEVLPSAGMSSFHLIMDERFLITSLKGGAIQSGDFVRVLIFQIAEAAGLSFDRLLFEARKRTEEVVPRLKSNIRLIFTQLAKRASRKKPKKGPRKTAERKPKKRTTLLERDPMEDGVPVINAGLVILAPYLSRYFSLLGLVQNKSFVNDDARDRSIHLLQYLVNGQPKSAEHLLLFNKVLCGMPPENAVSKGIEPQENEIAISEQLLKGVIQNWETIKRTSVEGFKQTFLQRTGLLLETESLWMMRVDEAPFDMLMKTLPWSISMVKLSWMDKPLQVEWKY